MRLIPFVRANNNEIYYKYKYLLSDFKFSSIDDMYDLTYYRFYLILSLKEVDYEIMNKNNNSNKKTANTMSDLMNLL